MAPTHRGHGYEHEHNVDTQAAASTEELRDHPTPAAPARMRLSPTRPRSVPGTPPPADLRRPPPVTITPPTRKMQREHAEGAAAAAAAASPPPPEPTQRAPPPHAPPRALLSGAVPPLPRTAPGGPRREGLRPARGRGGFGGTGGGAARLAPPETAGAAAGPGRPDGRAVTAAERLLPPPLPPLPPLPGPRRRC